MKIGYVIFVILMIFLLLISANLVANTDTNNLNLMSMSEIKIFPLINFIQNKNTLIVTIAELISPTTGCLDWSNVDKGDSRCDLPSGFIHAGDIITNCSGTVILRWIPTNTLINFWNFR